MKAVFFSDAHLTSEDQAQIRAVVETMRTVSKDADMVFILGDLFEFYHGFHGHIYPFYRIVVDLLKEIASRRPVYFLEGNHEFRMGSFFESYTGVKCVETLAINIDGKKAFLSHGDDIGSPLLRRLLKSRFVYSLMDAFGPDLTWRIAMACRPLLSRRHKSYDARIRNRFRRYGAKKLREGYDVVIMAHSHMPDREEYESGGKKKIYINTGDLVHSATYGEYVTEKGFAVRTYGKSPEREE